MNRLLRITLAAAVAFLSNDTLVHWLYVALVALFPYGDFPWGDRAHTALVALCMVGTFNFAFARLPDLPRMAASALAAALSIGPISGGVFWVLNGLIPPNTPAHAYIWGLCAIAAYSFFYRLIRLPKLSWLY